MGYDALDRKPNLSRIQEEVLEFWEDEKVFEKSVEKNHKGEIVFYGGPPFPTGIPHHGTVLVSFIKDMIARYWTMRGYCVPRVWGWDCHGLPIENQAEKVLGIESKDEIDTDIGKFNDACYDIVSKSNEEWRKYVKQMARWVDYDGAYKTMNITFMESVMWAFKKCYDKGLIYKDYRVTPYCMQCETSLSISDTRESDSTRPRQDRWVIAKFKADFDFRDKPVFFLAWTTTPWTLPSNMCLSVGATVNYSFVELKDEVYILSTDTIEKYDKLFGNDAISVKECTGSSLEGMTYEPLFPYYAKYKEQGAFKIVTVEYIDSTDGVGIVHTAPAFGEDDYWTCKKYGLPFVNPVDAQGRFTEDVFDFHSPDDPKNVIETNASIIRYLYKHKKAVLDGTIEHNYPHCWRCREPLIYRAMDAWYFNIEKIKDRLIAANDEINWIPETVKHGRFGNWLENARDWNISRNRYWSTPMPIWNCESCCKQVVLGSIDEIYEASGMRMHNLHRQYMDEVTFKCKNCGAAMRRIPEVLDCWFESGSVTFAQKHYPFENKVWFEAHFPSDFIVEYTGQIRCWFYYLHVLSVALFDKPAFKNCVVHGTILASDGKKLSKSSKNYSDPMDLMKKFGTDAFRLYMYQSNAMLIGDLHFDEEGIADMYQLVLLPFWNACNFYILYANIDEYHPRMPNAPETKNQLDRWMLAELNSATKKIEQGMDLYHIDRYIAPVVSLVNGLTNWYIRRSRRRFWDAGMPEDKKNAYETLYYVLVNTTKLLAPIAPILSEMLYKTLTDDYSVHLAQWPKIPEVYADEELISRVYMIHNIITLARSIRNKNMIKNRQPLSLMKVAFTNEKTSKHLEEFADTIAEELNVKRVEIIKDVSDIATIKYDPNFNEIRNRYPERVSEIIKAVKSGQFELCSDEAVLTIGGKRESFDAEIILVTYKSREDMPVASDRGIVVALDLTITDELRCEGLARDIVRNIQEARKQLNCNIMDRIKIEIIGDYPLQWTDYIQRETLSTIVDKVNALATIEIQDNAEGTIFVNIENAESFGSTAT